MEFQAIMDMVMQQGIWCALFVYLFISSQKKNDEREAKYISIVETYGTQLQEISINLKGMRADIEDLKK